jgi:hypothetical protein
MRVECDHDRRSVGRPGVFGGSRDDRLMAEMNAVEDANGEKERAWQARQFGNGPENFHQLKSEIRNPKFETSSKFKIRMFETASLDC